MMVCGRRQVVIVLTNTGRGKHVASCLSIIKSSQLAHPSHCPFLDTMKCFKCHSEIGKMDSRGLSSHQRGRKCKTAALEIAARKKRKADTEDELANKKAKRGDDEVSKKPNYALVFG